MRSMSLEVCKQGSMAIDGEPCLPPWWPSCESLSISSVVSHFSDLAHIEPSA